MEDKDFNIFSDNQDIIANCPICHQRYKPLVAKVLEEGNTASLVHIVCQNCQAAILAMILANNMGLSTFGLITDLNYDDAVKFQNAKPISYNDVLELHQNLAKQKVPIDFLNNN
ncbi:MAG: hypothetical protein WCW26_02900 [Candidatus Buchananbacteria bacterium]